MGVALRPQHFAQSYSAWWITGLAISKSHTFELLAQCEVQRCEGAVLEGVNVAWNSRVQGAYGNGEIGESSWTILWMRPWGLSTLHRVIVCGG